MNIPDEAVEAARVALSEHVDASACCARAALEAAAPHLKAQAWDEWVTYVCEGGVEVPDDSPLPRGGQAIPDEASTNKQAMIDAALKIHSPYGAQMGQGLRWVDPKCRECETRWPCSTVNALTAKVTWGAA